VKSGSVISVKTLLQAEGEAVVKTTISSNIALDHIDSRKCFMVWFPEKKTKKTSLGDNKRSGSRCAPLN